MKNLTIGFIGLGLIGGSIAKSIRKFFPDFTLMAYSHSPSTTKAAFDQKVIDVILEKEDSQFALCDYIFLCAPVQTNMEYLPFLKKTMKSTCILTDVGSIKNDMHKTISEAGMNGHFIGGHPMAGSEKTGFASSSDYLLENAYYILTPSPGTKEEDLAQYTDLVQTFGAVPLVMDPENHDFIVAGISHLPHIVASSLVNTVASLDTDNQEMKLVAAGGFKDITRIASSSPVMWQQICLTNKEMILKVLDHFTASLQEMRKNIAADSSDALLDNFQNSKNYRDSILDIKYGASQKQHVIYVDIYDKVGGIAFLTMLMAHHEINLKNINILHNREFEEGVLRIEFYQEAACDKAIEVLENNKYIVHKRM